MDIYITVNTYIYISSYPLWRGHLYLQMKFFTTYEFVFTNKKPKQEYLLIYINVTCISVPLIMGGILHYWIRNNHKWTTYVWGKKYGKTYFKRKVLFTSYPLHHQLPSGGEGLGDAYNNKLSFWIEQSIMVDVDGWYG